MAAPLHMRSYWLEEFHLISAREVLVTETGVNVRMSKPTVAVQPDDANHYLVRLRVKVATANQTIDATLAGLFELVGDTQPEHGPSSWVQYNAPSILYGLLRGLTAALTGASDTGRVDLPSINMAALIES